VALATAPLLLAPTACSAAGTGSGSPAAGSTHASPSPDASASAGTSAVADPPAVPAAPESPRAGKGRAGQRQFAQFVLAAWSWSLRSNDATPLLDASLGTEPCGGCTPLRKELRGRDAEGWYVDFPGLRVDRIRLRPAGADVVAEARVGVPESDALNDDGSYRSTSPAHEDATFTVRMRLVKGDYLLVSFSLA
jgi:hypothetical protein